LCQTCIQDGVRALIALQPTKRRKEVLLFSGKRPAAREAKGLIYFVLWKLALALPHRREADRKLCWFFFKNEPTNA
jgi:hypothetical protein